MMPACHLDRRNASCQLFLARTYRGNIRGAPVP